MKQFWLFMKTTTKFVRSYLVVVCFLTVHGVSISIDRSYHDLGEINAELVELREEYPDWVSLDSIGHSSMYSLPIWMVKISDNPQQAENEPAILFIGQVHAEELIGVELTLYLMRYLVENLDEDGFSERLEGLEIYFIPTVNPEGLRVIHSGEDETFRKNCRDNIGDGELRLQDGVGWDSSGVDINRNFALHWDRGEGLFVEGEDYVYNYYRGPAAFSEPETQVLRDLALQKRFVYSISYHSSRSGQNEELVIAPWTWDGRGTPDHLAIDALLDTLASQIPLQIDEDRFYIPVHSMQRLGQSLDWFYQAAGTFQYIIEIGAEIQPDSVVLGELIQDQLASVLYILDLACGQQTLEGFGQLRIQTVDANSGEPIGVKVVNQQLSSPILEPRYTTGETGRYSWLLPVGNYDFSFSAQGYVSDRVEGVQIAFGEINILNIELDPLPLIEVNISVHNRQGDQPLATLIRLYTDSEIYGTWFVPQDGLQLELAVASYQVEVIVEGYLPEVTEIEFSPDNADITINLSSAEITFDAQFDEMGNWQHGGEGDDWGVIDYDNRSVLTESANGAYPNDSAPWLLIQTGAEIRAQYRSVMRLIHRPYFEPGADSGRVNLWNRDNNAWETRAVFSQFPTGWDTTYIDCAGLPEGSIAVRFQVTSDEQVTEDGWLIDRLTIYRSTIIQDVVVKPALPDGLSVSLFPNPTNGLTLLQLKLIKSGYYQYHIYDSIGRFVVKNMVGILPAGEHRFVVDTGQFSAGVYYLNIASENSYQVMKLTLLK